MLLIQHAHSEFAAPNTALKPIGALATFAVWLVGKLAELKHWQRQYQANTVATKPVLSTFFLGLQVLRRMTTPFSGQDFRQAIQALQQQDRLVYKT